MCECPKHILSLNEKSKLTKKNKKMLYPLRNCTHSSFDYEILKNFYELIQKNVGHFDKIDLYCGKIYKIISKQNNYYCSIDFWNAWKALHFLLTDAKYIKPNFEKELVLMNEFLYEWQMYGTVVPEKRCFVYNKLYCDLKAVCESLGNWQNGIFQKDFDEIREKIKVIQNLLEIVKRITGIFIPEHGKDLEFDRIRIG